jgi:hypothetical protein
VAGRLVDPREGFPFLGFRDDNPLRVDEGEFRGVLDGVAGKRRDEMAGFGEGEEPSRRGRTMFADQTEGGRTI